MAIMMRVMMTMTATTTTMKKVRMVFFSLSVARSIVGMTSTNHLDKMRVRHFMAWHKLNLCMRLRYGRGTSYAANAGTGFGFAHF